MKRIYVFQKKLIEGKGFILSKKLYLLIVKLLWLTRWNLWYTHKFVSMLHRRIHYTPFKMSYFENTEWIVEEDMNGFQNIISWEEGGSSTDEVEKLL